MAQTNCSTELDETLHRLEQNFFLKLAIITEHRMKLERESTSSIPPSTSPKREKLDSKTKPRRAKINASLGEIIVKSKKVADEFENDIAAEKTRKAWYDRLETLRRKQKELDKREVLLVKSVREIETYLRAIFFLKQKADRMKLELKSISDQHDENLQELKEHLSNLTERHGFAVRAKNAFEPVKRGLQKVLSECDQYESVRELIDYYLVLQELQQDILAQESESAKEEEKLAAELKEAVELQRGEPLVRMAKEETLLRTKTKLRDTQNQTASLNKQIAAAVFSKVKDDAGRYETQRWIQTMFQSCCKVKPLGPQGLLDTIRDFVEDMQQIVQKLKKN